MKNILETFLIFKALIEYSMSTVYAFSEYPYYQNEYEKYSSDMNKNNDIPTLENLFQKVSFIDSSNISSSCPHRYGIKRDTLCQKIVTFDRDGYEKSLQDTRKLILSRLKLEHEPKIEINKNTLSFIEQIEKNLSEDVSDSDTMYSTMKTKYDMKRSESNEFNSMHEASAISNSCHDKASQISDRICIHFELPIKNFFTEVDNRLVRQNIVSSVLWIYAKLSDRVTDEMHLRVKVEGANNSKKSIKSYVRKLKDEWSSIRITKIFDLETPESTLFINDTMSIKVEVKCYEDCTIAYSNSNQELNYIPGDENYPDVLIDTGISRKPMLSVNIKENKRSFDLTNQLNNIRIRNKRKTHNGHNNNLEKISSKLCYNNYPDSERECCLIRYFVNFNSLKWSSWILSPNGFEANYCSGKCNELKSFRHASHNAEVKLKYNEKLLSQDSIDSSEMLETCCHPISMDSLVVKYLASNGSVVSTILPNMIVTGCGCS